MMPTLKIERCEQSYTDTDARSAQTYSYGELSVISPRLHTESFQSSAPDPRAPEDPRHVIGWSLSSVRLQSPAFGALVLVTDPEDPRPPLH